MILALGIYAATMQVTAIKNDVVQMETASGFVYEWEGADDYEVGDLVSVLMNGLETEEITDDVIISPPTYTGWTMPVDVLHEGDVVTVDTEEKWFHLNGQVGTVTKIEDNGNHVLVDFGIEECWFLARELR